MGHSIGLNIAPEFPQFLDDKQTITMFCHGTEKRVNGIKKSSIGLGSGYEKSVKLTCQGQDFFYGETKFDMDQIYSASCRRIQEPFIIRDEKSTCRWISDEIETCIFHIA